MYVTTKDGSESASETVASGTNPDIFENNVTTLKPGANILTVLDPNGAPLDLVNAGGDSVPVVSVKGPKPDDTNHATTTVTGGKVDVSTLASGKYDIVVEQNGMLVTKEITVSGSAPTATISGSNVIKIPAFPVNGSIEYAADSKKSTDATVTITSPDGSFTWGTAKVGKDGKYSVAGIPEGNYKVAVTVVDPAIRATQSR